MLMTAILHLARVQSSRKLHQQQLPEHSQMHVLLGGPLQLQRGLLLQLLLLALQQPSLAMQPPSLALQPPTLALQQPSLAVQQLSLV